MFRIPIDLVPSDFGRAPLEPKQALDGRDTTSEPFAGEAGVQRTTDDHATHRPIAVLGNFEHLGHALLFAMVAEDTEAMPALREAVQATATLDGCVHGGDATRH